MTVALGKRINHRYRPCVGAMIVDHEGRVLVGQRANAVFNDRSWQMPQGGIDGDETPQQALSRELREEIGTDDFTILAYIAPWLYYDLPSELVSTFWNGRFLGQKQKWFLVQLNGGAQSVNIATEVPEFQAIQWIDAAQVLDHVVPFKYDVYQAVLRAFLPQIQRMQKSGKKPPSDPIAIETLASVV